MNFHCIPRFTEDIDLFVAPVPDNVERLRHALRDDPAIEEILVEDLAGSTLWFAMARRTTS